MFEKSRTLLSSALALTGAACATLPDESAYHSRINYAEELQRDAEADKQRGYIIPRYSEHIGRMDAHNGGCRSASFAEMFSVPVQTEETNVEEFGDGWVSQQYVIVADPFFEYLERMGASQAEIDAAVLGRRLACREEQLATLGFYYPEDLIPPDTDATDR